MVEFYYRQDWKNRFNDYPPYWEYPHFYKNQKIYSKIQQGADKENILELNQIRTQKVKKFI